MINAIRRPAAVLAALVAIGGAGAGIAGAATPDTAAPARTGIAIGERTWDDPFCRWGEDFDWHYYRYCDNNFWHGRHFEDWQRFDRDHRGHDYDRHR